MQQVMIIDYGMGNIHSVQTALQAVADQQTLVRCSSDIADIKNADKLVFPGVGAIRDTIMPLQQQGLAALLPDLLLSRPSLAICVGLQALATFSEENQGTDCLGMIPAQVRRFDPAAMQQARQRSQRTDTTSISIRTPEEDQQPFKIPHMGWNQVRQVQHHPLWHKIADNSYFYFVHSYYLALSDNGLLAGSCNYGIDFPAAICMGSLFATQFHPEKSDHAGLQLIRNFLHWDGQ